MARILLGVLLALVGLPAWAVEERGDERLLWLRAGAVIGADGRIVALEWKGKNEIEEMLGESLTPVVRGWQFDPGRIDGVPAQTRTTLQIRALPEEDTDGNLRLRVLGAGTGASSERMTPPRYPSDALRAGVSAEVISEISIAADGTVAIERHEFEGSGKSAYRRAFIRAAEEAIQGWSFTLEQVDGHPVATRMRVPITFCVGNFQGMKWCDERKAMWVRMETMASPDMPVALESAVRLITDPTTPAI